MISGAWTWTGDAENNSTDQYSGTNTDLAFQDFGVNVPEIHLDLGMGLNVSSGQAICTKVRQNLSGSSAVVASAMMLVWEIMHVNWINNWIHFYFESLISCFHQLFLGFFFFSAMI